MSRDEWFKGLLYGLINASICLPASISFSTIIFRHEAFAPYLPVLVRLVLLSSAVHATIFVWLSSMPFAVGQVQVRPRLTHTWFRWAFVLLKAPPFLHPFFRFSAMSLVPRFSHPPFLPPSFPQDAGLIFLSSMASTLADYCRQHKLSDAVLLSTTLVLLSLSTALVGLSLILMGKLRLASAVTYIPMAAVSGYLAFIGLFAFNAGTLRSAYVVVACSKVSVGSFLCLLGLSLRSPAFVFAKITNTPPSFPFSHPPLPSRRHQLHD